MCKLYPGDTEWFWALILITTAVILFLARLIVKAWLDDKQGKPAEIKPMGDPGANVLLQIALAAVGGIVLLFGTALLLELSKHIGLYPTLERIAYVGMNVIRGCPY
jgi:hypothetical protein